MPSVDLGDLFRDQEARLPDDENSNLLLSARNLPRPPSRVRTDELAARWRWHQYGVPVPIVNFFGTPRGYRQLGLLVLARLFYPATEPLALDLASPGFTVEDGGLKRLVLDFSPESHGLGPYQSTPTSLDYWPIAFDRTRTWDRYGLPKDDYPYLCLDQPNEHASWDALPSYGAGLRGFGGDRANAFMAQLFLDLGSSVAESKGLALEADCGYGGVAPGSAEMEFGLPGYDHYYAPSPW